MHLERRGSITSTHRLEQAKAVAYAMNGARRKPKKVGDVESSYPTLFVSEQINKYLTRKYERSRIGYEKKIR